MFVLRDTHGFICYWKWSLVLSSYGTKYQFSGPSFFPIQQIYPLSWIALEFSLAFCTKKQNCFNLTCMWAQLWETILSLSSWILWLHICLRDTKIMLLVIWPVCIAADYWCNILSSLHRTADYMLGSAVRCWVQW